MFCDSPFLFSYFRNTQVESPIAEYFIQIDGIGEDKSGRDARSSNYIKNNLLLIISSRVSPEWFYTAVACIMQMQSIFMPNKSFSIYSPPPPEIESWKFCFASFWSNQLFMAWNYGKRFINQETEWNTSSEERSSHCSLSKNSCKAATKKDCEKERDNAWKR